MQRNIKTISQDVSQNCTNIIASMKMEPFSEIMKKYKKKILDYEKQLELQNQ